jgi:hypothetical protein
MNRLIIFVAILALVAGFASAQPESSNVDTGKELIAQLYNEHSGKSDPLQYPASKKRLPSYFYKPLLDLYLKDQEDSKGEVGKIDFDPPSTILRILKSRVSTWSCSLIKKGTWRPDLRIWASTKKSSSHFSGQKWDGALLTFDTRTGVRFGRY